MMTTYPLGLDPDLLAEVKRTAEDTGLSQADAMRQALKRGLPQVREALCVKPSVLDEIKPLSKTVLNRLYRTLPDDDGLEDIDRIMASQSKTADE
jgi:hypothetical protein